MRSPYEVGWQPDAGVVRRVVVKRSCSLAVTILVLVAAALAGSTGVASAGGSSWVFDRQHYQPGDTAFAWAAIAWEHNPDLATRDEGPYHAAIFPITEPGQVVGGEAVPVGEISVFLEPYGAGQLRFGPHHAELSFTVPDLRPGRYGILHANAAGEFVGDLSGSGLFWIDVRAVRASPSFTG
jgi:hypothetical protein